MTLFMGELLVCFMLPEHSLDIVLALKSMNFMDD